MLYAAQGNGHNGQSGRVERVGHTLFCVAVDIVIERLWEAGLDELIVWAALLGIAVAVAYYVIGKVRAAPAQREPKASELLSKFRETHSRGGLSDEEFRTIKTTLTDRLREELSDNEETG